MDKVVDWPQLILERPKTVVACSISLAALTTYVVRQRLWMAVTTSATISAAISITILFWAKRESTFIKRRHEVDKTIQKILKSEKALQEIKKKFSDRQFSPASQVAQVSGVYLKSFMRTNSGKDVRNIIFIPAQRDEVAQNEGAFKKCYKSRAVLNYGTVSVHTVPIAYYTVSNDENRKYEWEIYRNLCQLPDTRHPNVHRPWAFTTPSVTEGLHIFSRWHDHNLPDSPRLDPQNVIDILAQVLLGLRHLHEHNIVYRDLKPSNIVLSFVGEKIEVAITDLDFARKVDNVGIGWCPREKEEVSDGVRLYPLIGTAAYVAPEGWTDNKVGRPLDIWAFGVTAYGLIYRAGRKFPRPSFIDQAIKPYIESSKKPHIKDEIGERVRKALRKPSKENALDAILRDSDLPKEFQFVIEQIAKCLQPQMNRPKVEALADTFSAYLEKISKDR